MSKYLAKRKTKYTYEWFYRYYWLLKRRAKKHKRLFELSFEVFKELKINKNQIFLDFTGLTGV